ncbi:MAG: DMT family transporter [Chloroflexota bacterium]
MNPKQSNPMLAYLTLSFGILTISSSPILMRLADAPGPVTTFYRMAIATIVVAFPFYRHAKNSGGLNKTSLKIALLAGAFFALDLATWSTGVMLAGATIPTLLANTAPVWVGLGAMVVFKEKLGGKFWVGLILGILGSFVIFGMGIQEFNQLTQASLLGLVAAIFYAAYFLSIQRAREKIDYLTTFWLSSFSSAVGLLIITTLLRQPLTGYGNKTYLYFLAIGLVTQVIGWLSSTHALGHLPASIVSPSLLLQPVLTGLMAGPILGEQFSNPQIVGGIIVLLGVLIIHYSRQPNKLKKT